MFFQGGHANMSTTSRKKEVPIMLFTLTALVVIGGAMYYNTVYSFTR